MLTRFSVRCIITASTTQRDNEMTTANAVTNESGLNFNKTLTVGYSGHGGITKSCYSDFKLKTYKGSIGISSLSNVEGLNPSALKGLLKCGASISTKVTHQLAYIKKINKKGKEYDSVLGHYISLTLKGIKFSTLIKGYSCLFFVDDKKVTYIPEKAIK